METLYRASHRHRDFNVSSNDKNVTRKECSIVKVSDRSRNCRNYRAIDCITRGRLSLDFSLTASAMWKIEGCEGPYRGVDFTTASRVDGRNNVVQTVTLFLSPSLFLSAYLLHLIEFIPATHFPQLHSSASGKRRNEVEFERENIVKRFTSRGRNARFDDVEVEFEKC